MVDPFDPKKSHNRSKIAAANIPNAGNIDDEDLELEVSQNVAICTNDYLE